MKKHIKSLSIIVSLYCFMSTPLIAQINVKCDTNSDQNHRAINNAILGQSIAKDGKVTLIATDGIVTLSGECKHTDSIRLKSNIKLILTPDAKLIATGSISDQIIVTDKSNVEISGSGIIDSNNLADNSINVKGTNGITIKGITFINWSNAIRVATRKGTLENSNVPSKDILIENNNINTPGNAAIYPIWVGAPKGTEYVTNARIKNNTVVGEIGAFNSDNSSTADQIVIFGVDTFWVEGNKSSNCGENCMTIARGSKNGVISSNILMRADGHGLHIGYVSDNAIEEPPVTDIVVSNNIIKNNGLNEGNSMPVLSGIFIRGANNLSVSGNRVTGDQQEYGLYATRTDQLFIGENLLEGSINSTYFAKIGSETQAVLAVKKHYGSVATPKLHALDVVDNNATLSSNYVHISTKINGTTLKTLNGGSDGMMISLRISGQQGAVLTLKDSNVTNGFRLTSDADLLISNPNIVLTFRFDKNMNNGAWLQM